MTDYYGVSGRRAEAKEVAMSDAECERKIALLRAAWATFDDVASRVSSELRKGPRGGGREREEIVHHANGSEIFEYGKKVGVRSSPDARQDAGELRAHRDAWTVQFLIRRSAWHMLDHAREMEDRDLSPA